MHQYIASGRPWLSQQLCQVEPQRHIASQRLLELSPFSQTETFVLSQLRSYRNKITLDAAGSPHTFNLKCRELFVDNDSGLGASVTVLAGTQYWWRVQPHLLWYHRTIGRKAMANYYINKASVGHSVQFQASDAHPLPPHHPCRNWNRNFISECQNYHHKKADNGVFALRLRHATIKCDWRAPSHLLHWCWKGKPDRWPTGPQDYEVLAELTGIEEEYELSGSGIDAP